MPPPGWTSTPPPRESAKRGLAVSDDDDRTLADLLAEQVEFANVILINKTDLVTAKELARLKSFLASLQPRCAAAGGQPRPHPAGLRAQHGPVRTRCGGATAALGRRAPRPSHPETDEYGVSSFVYQARTPFHPQRLYDFIRRGGFKRLLRSKGFLWLASDHDMAYDWSQVGQRGYFEQAGRWWAAEPRGTGPTMLSCNWRSTPPGPSPTATAAGDRLASAEKLKKEKLIARLNACLLTDAELAGWQAGQFTPENPFLESEDDAK